MLLILILRSFTFVSRHWRLPLLVSPDVLGESEKQMSNAFFFCQFMKFQFVSQWRDIKTYVLLQFCPVSEDDSETLVRHSVNLYRLWTLISIMFNLLISNFIDLWKLCFLTSLTVEFNWSNNPEVQRRIHNRSSVIPVLISNHPIPYSDAYFINIRWFLLIFLISSSAFFKPGIKPLSLLFGRSGRYIVYWGFN